MEIKLRQFDVIRVETHQNENFIDLLGCPGELGMIIQCYPYCQRIEVRQRGAFDVGILLLQHEEAVPKHWEDTDVLLRIDRRRGK